MRVVYFFLFEAGIAAASARTAFVHPSIADNNNNNNNIKRNIHSYRIRRQHRKVQKWHLPLNTRHSNSQTREERRDYPLKGVQYPSSAIMSLGNDRDDDGGTNGKEEEHLHDPHRHSIYRLYTGLDDGLSHVERLPLDMSPYTDREGSFGFGTNLVACTGITFRVSPPGYVLKDHCAPRRQYVIQLSGQTEIVTSNGTSIVMYPGDVVLAEDLTGAGHTTRAVGPEDRFYAVLPLPENNPT